jgi:AcrR family transcriptional regulator
MLRRLQRASLSGGRSLGGMPVARVAKLIGVSVPTLRLHYGNLLQP